MDAIIRQVRDINDTERRLLENLLGQELREDQRVAVRILPPEVVAGADGVSPAVEPAPGQAPAPSLPDWCRVYEGLSDTEIADVESLVLRRSDLTRPS